MTGSVGSTGMGRAFPRTDYQAIKSGFRRLVKMCGGQESAAGVTRVDFQRIGRYSRPHEPMFPPADVIADLEKDAEVPEVTRVLADLQGYLLIAKPPASGDPQWVGHLAALAKESGEALSLLGQALSNGGTITAEEIAELDLRREVSEAMEVLARIDIALRAVQSGSAQKGICGHGEGCE